MSKMNGFVDLESGGMTTDELRAHAIVNGYPHIFVINSETKLEEISDSSQISLLYALRDSSKMQVRIDFARIQIQSCERKLNPWCVLSRFDVEDTRPYNGLFCFSNENDAIFAKLLIM